MYCTWELTVGEWDCVVFVLHNPLPRNIISLNYYCFFADYFWQVYTLESPKARVSYSTLFTTFYARLSHRQLCNNIGICLCFETVMGFSANNHPGWKPTSSYVRIFSLMNDSSMIWEIFNFSALTHPSVLCSPSNLHYLDSCQSWLVLENLKCRRR